jgi:hypothetical protein
LCCQHTFPPLFWLPNLLLVTLSLDLHSANQFLYNHIMLPSVEWIPVWCCWHFLGICIKSARPSVLYAPIIPLKRDPSYSQLAGSLFLDLQQLHNNARSIDNTRVRKMGNKNITEGAQDMGKWNSEVAGYGGTMMEDNDKMTRLQAAGVFLLVKSGKEPEIPHGF